MLQNPGSLTDAQARSLVIKALRQARAAYRRSDTAAQKFEREIDRLIKRKTRINSSSMVTLSNLYDNYTKLAVAVQVPLGDAYAVTSQF